MTALASIGLIPNAQTRHLIVDIVRELRRRHGSEIHVYCANEQERSFYASLATDGIFTSIGLIKSLVDGALAPVANLESEIATARAYEARLGRTYGSLVVGNRHLGRGYALGGNHHPRSRHSERSSYIQVLAAYNRYFAFWEREVREKRLTVFVGGPVEVSNAARLNGLPHRRLAESRYGNLHFWAHNEFSENPAVAAAYKRVAALHLAPPQNQQAYKSVGTLSRLYRRQNSLLGLTKNVLLVSTQRPYWYVKSLGKKRGYYGTDEIRMLVRRWVHGRRMSSRKLCRLEDLAGTPFIFFPLATEPETALQQLSPEFFFQHAAIAALSRDLPAGVRLVVKEAIMGVGRRPSDFYEQIGELKNVVWMNMLEPGIEVARRAEAIAVITGSTGFEAAVMGKPVISFGMHNAYNILPHVQHVTDLARTGRAVARIFDGSIDPAAARRAGAAFLRAVVETSFDLGSYDYVDLRRYEPEVVHAACDALEESLSDLRAGATAASVR